MIRSVRDQGPTEPPLIPYGRQSISEADIEAVAAVLRSPFLTQGPAVPAFEAALAAKVEAPFAVAANSATSALHLACLALGLGPGDVMWTVPNTFVATANVALQCGADVDFVDIDPETFVMCPKALEAKLGRAAREGRLPKVVTPVHFAGQSVDMAALAVLADRYGFRVLEDASHAVGALYEGRPVGACPYSEIAVFSFHPVKIITTGEGGAAVTRNERLAARMRLLRTHGVTREPDELTRAPDGPWSYEQIALGYNYRLSDIQAALGLSQLQRLEAFVARRREIAGVYDAALQSTSLARAPYQDPKTRSSWHLYVARLAEGLDRRQVFEALRRQGVGVQVHYIPVHAQPFYQARGHRLGDYPAAEAYYRSAITLPIFPELAAAEQAAVLAAFFEALNAAAGAG